MFPTGPALISEASLKIVLVQLAALIREFHQGNFGFVRFVEAFIYNTRLFSYTRLIMYTYYVCHVLRSRGSYIVFRIIAAD